MDARAAEALVAVMLRSEGRDSAADLLGPWRGEAAERLLFDALGLALARQFHFGDCDFRSANRLANSHWSLMLDRFMARANGTSLCLSTTMTAVYECFDAGEFRHPGDAADRDPVMAYTKPMIADVLRTREVAQYRAAATGDASC